MPKVELRPSKAAWVDENATSENHGIGTPFSEFYMWLRSESGKDRRMYMQYDFTTSGDVLNGVALPSTDSTIIRSFLSARCSATTGSTTERTLDTAREVTAAWDSSTITWSTVGGGAGQPAKSTTRGARAYSAVQGAPSILDSSGFRDVTQGWIDKTLTNNGCYLISTVEDSTVGSSTSGYGWQFRGDVVSGLMLDISIFPKMVVEYRDVDTLPATATDSAKQFVGKALTALNRSHITDYSFTLTLELDDGDVVVTDDVVAFSRIERKLPFLLDNKLDLGRATFQLFNDDGKYSPNKKSSVMYARRAIGRNMKLDLTVADQTVTLFSGEIQTVDTMSDGRVEIMGEQQPIERQFQEILSQQNLSSVLTIYNANPADAVYEILKQAGVPDTAINLSTFINSKASWTTSGMTVGTLWADKTAAEMISFVLEAALGSLYFDWQGRYALHFWAPTEPSVTALEDFESYTWGEDFGKIRNLVQVEYNQDMNSPIWYFDGESQADWKVRELRIRNPLLGVPGRAASVAVMYTQALADPVGMGTVSGDMRLLQFDLTKGVTLTDAENEIDEDCIVTGITFDPVNRSASIDIIKANWPAPRRDFVNDSNLTWGDPLGEEEYPGGTGTPLNDPTPSDFSFSQANDGSVFAVPQWTQTTGAAKLDGYIAYCNHSTTAGQVIPSTVAADEVLDVPVSAALVGQKAGLAGFSIPQDHYATFAVQGYRVRSQDELFVGQTDRQYSGIVTSSSTPDWTDRQYSTGVVITGDTTGTNYGDNWGDVFNRDGDLIVDTSDGLILTDTGGTRLDINNALLTADVIGETSGLHKGDSTGDSYGLHKGDSTGDTYGLHDGDSTGNTYGGHIGETSGKHVGDTTGDTYGAHVGESSGLHVGLQDGDSTGNTYGLHTGDSTGTNYGDNWGDVKSSDGTLLIDGSSALMTTDLAIANQKNLIQVAAANNGANLSSSLDLRSTDITTGLARIDWTQFNAQYGFGSVTYPSGSVLNKARGVVYHVYYTGADVGSTSGYSQTASTVWTDVVSGNNNFYIGSIRTATTSVTTGTAGGGGGDPAE